MGFEHLYKMGTGEGVVLNLGAEAIKIYANQLAQRDLAVQKEREKWAKELEAIGDFKGARPQDHEYLTSQWGKVLEKNHAREMSTNKAERIKLSTEMQLLKKQMMSDANRSVQEYAMDKQLLTLPLQKDPDELNPNYRELIAGRNKTSTFNPAFNNYSVENFSLAPKPYDINADINLLSNIAAKEVSEEFTVGSGLDTRRAYREGKQLDEDAFRSLILNRISTNPAARRAYLRGAEPTEENIEIALLAAVEAVRDKFALKTRESNLVDQSGREMSLYKQKAAISDSYKDDDNSSPSTTSEESTVIPFGRPKDNSFVKVFNTQKLSPSRINITGTEGINLITGKPMRVPNLENSVSISTIADVPIIGGSLKLGGRVAQPKFAADNPDKVKYKRTAFVTFKDGSGTDQTLLIPVEALPTTNKVINTALKNMPSETYKHPKASSPSNEYQNVRTLKDSSGKTYQAGVKGGVWYNIANGKKL